MTCGHFGQVYVAVEAKAFYGRGLVGREIVVQIGRDHIGVNWRVLAHTGHRQTPLPHHFAYAPA